jgi:granule-bound starch synthase
MEEGLAEILGVPQRFIDNIPFQMPIEIGAFNRKVDCVNHLAAGLLYSDLALSVSPTYALEISTLPEKGVELEKLFLARGITGILNGIKEAVSAADENFLAKAFITCGPFTVDTVDVAKAEMKRAYLSQSTLPASEGPLVCFIGRLDVQKGYDLLLAALAEVLLDTEMQVVIIGSGRTDLTTQTKDLAKQFPSKVRYEGWMGPERYAVIGACDYTLFPSRWEPCGLVQMECMRLGTVPVVAPTGGLKDSVEDGITGFWTDTLMTDECTLCEESAASIGRVLRRMANSYTSSPKKVTEMRQAAMAASAEFTWSNAALQYEAVFEKLGVVDVLPHCTDGFVTLQADALVS